MDKREHFIFRGKSSREYHMYIEKGVAFPSPEQDVSFVEVLGRDGDVAIDNHRAKSTTLSIPVIVRPPKGVRLSELASRISGWLKGERGWQTLQFGGAGEYEYRAMVVDRFDVQSTILDHGRAVIVFRVQPYKRKVGVKAIEVKQSTTLVNAHDRESKPLIQVEGLGDIVIRNNGQPWVQLVDIHQGIEIDSDFMDVYRGTTPKYHKMKDLGNFPTLKPGPNTITWTGKISKLLITPNWESIV